MKWGGQIWDLVLWQLLLLALVLYDEGSFEFLVLLLLPSFLLLFSSALVFLLDKESQRTWASTARRTVAEQFLLVGPVSAPGVVPSPPPVVSPALSAPASASSPPSPPFPAAWRVWNISSRLTASEGVSLCDSLFSSSNVEHHVVLLFFGPCPKLFAASHLPLSLPGLFLLQLLLFLGSNLCCGLGAKLLCLLFVLKLFLWNQQHNYHM